MLDLRIDSLTTGRVAYPVSFTPLPFVKPEQVFQRACAERHVAWLDSSLARDGDGRFSIMGWDPAWVFVATNDCWHRADRTGETASGRQGALAEVERLIDAARVAVSPQAPALPFQTGAIGWLAYDLGRSFESLPILTANDLDVPDLCVAWYDEALVWDHHAETLWFVSTRANASNTNLDPLLAQPAMAPGSAARQRSLAVSDFSRDEYLRAVDSVRAGIARGEYYQLNLVQRFTCELTEHPVQIYLRLRQLNPAPFSAFLQTDAFSVLCSSPERFIHVSPSGEVQTCPIKGTRPRVRDAANDRRGRAELTASPKERAELLMIVDLLRNDLGRVCIPGSVHVPRLHALESFATVHHLVGEVRGQLREGTTREQLLRAVFPGGSITGAPKISAMREIERLERHRRGIAMGSIGYLSAHGEIDFNIAIRTAVVRESRAHVSVGAGIVWDSDPAAEYAETLAKAGALFATLGVRAATA